jgi:aminomethyltransferase
MLKRTALFAAHQKLGARLVEFGGWEMPVQYTGIVDEHLAVRNAAGIFDICHMGEVNVTGPGACNFLNHLLTNNVEKLSIGQAQYTIMCNPQGGAIDDLYVYRIAQEHYFLIINASRIDADVAWIQQQAKNFPNARVENLSETYGALALQGPRTVEFVDRCFAGVSRGGLQVAHPSLLKKNEMGIFAYENIPVNIGRTGYTGEDGFEIVAPADKIEAIWNHVLKIGASFGLKPAGLGARDTLRTEVCYPLYGHELDLQTTPIEAGLGFFVALDKPDFIGRSVLAQQKANGVKKKLIAFKMTGKSAPPRPHYPIWSATGEIAKIGEVTSGTQSPSLSVGIGLGYVPPALAKAGNAIAIEIRGQRAPAQIVPRPIFRKG